MTFPELDFSFASSKEQRHHDSSMPELDFSFVDAGYERESSNDLPELDFSFTEKKKVPTYLPIEEYNKYPEQANKQEKIPSFLPIEEYNKYPEQMAGKYEMPSFGQQAKDFGSMLLKTPARMGYTVYEGINNVLALGFGVADYIDRNKNDTGDSRHPGQLGIARDFFHDIAEEQRQVLSGKKKAFGMLDISESDRIKGKKLWDNPMLVLNPEFVTKQFGDAFASMLPVIAGVATVGASSPGAAFVGGLWAGSYAYKSMLDDGVDEDDALLATAAIVPIAKTLEGVGMKAINIKKVTDSFWKKIKGASIAGAAESLTEYSEEIATAVVEGIAKYGISSKEAISSIWDKAKEAGKQIEALVGSAGVGASMHAARKGTIDTDDVSNVAGVFDGEGKTQPELVQEPIQEPVQEPDGLTLPTQPTSIQDINAGQELSGRDNRILAEINEALARKEIAEEDAIELIKQPGMSHLEQAVLGMVNANSQIDIEEGLLEAPVEPMTEPDVGTDEAVDTTLMKEPDLYLPDEPLVSLDFDESSEKFSTTDKHVLDEYKIQPEEIAKFFHGQKTELHDNGHMTVSLNNGTDITVERAKYLGDGKAEVLLKSQGKDSDGRILGSQKGRLVRLDKIYAKKDTLSHEGWHLAKWLGLVTDGDVSPFQKKIQKMTEDGTLPFELSKHKDKAIADEENEANLFSYIHKNREEYRGSAIGKVVQRVKDFFDGVIHIGRNSIAKTVRKFESGKVWDKEGSAKKDLVEKYMMIGRTSKNFDHDNAKASKRLLDAGVDPRDVWYKKGYLVGLDKKGRVEISDKDARLRIKGKNPKGKIKTTLGRVLHHPRLFEVYPHLKDLTITIDLTGKKRDGGMYSPSKQEIEVRRKDVASALSTVLHETQHSIQNAEGWAAGGNIDMFLSRIEEHLYNVHGKINVLKEAIKEGGLDKNSPEAKKLSLLMKEQDKYSTENKKKRAAFGMYQRLYGEAEARSTSSRKMMDDEMRSLIMPMDSQEVSVDKMIVSGVKDAEVRPDMQSIADPTTSDDVLARIEADRVEAKKSRLRDTREKELNIIKKVYGLTEKEFNTFHKKDLKNLSSDEYNSFRKQMARKALNFKKYRESRDRVSKLRKELELVNEKNLLKSLKAPSVSKMDLRQLKKYKDILSKYEKGDQFITPERTRSLKGSIFESMKTKREIIDAASKHLKVDKEVLRKITFSPLDRVLYDTPLAKKNPIYKFMVDTVKAKQLEAGALYIETRDKMLDLNAKAVKSRKQSVLGRIVPQQKLLMKYIESTGKDKLNALSKMTEEEVELAEYISGFYMKAFDYLRVNEDLASSRFKGKYVMHAKKPLSEALLGVKDAGIAKTIKELWKRSGDDTTNFETRTDTGESIGLSKFFKNTLFRKGEISPSQNVVRSTDIYMKQLFKKIALDKSIPAIDTLAQSLSNNHKIGQDMDSVDSLPRFIREYLNNKKGQRLDLKYKQGGVFDTAMRGLNTLLSLRYIALNIPLQASAIAGETMAKIPALGIRKLALAQARKRTVQGKKVLERYKSYIGDPVLKDLMQPHKTIGEKSNDLLYGILKWNRRQTNADILLGNMTKAEFKKGEISSKRLAEVTRLAGRWVSIEKSESVVGSTTIGKSMTKFRTWAVPIARSTSELAASTARSLTKLGDQKKRLTGEQMTELYRLAEAGVISTMLIAGAKEVADEIDEDSFVGKTINYLIRDLGTMTAAIGKETLISVGVTASFLARLAKSLKYLLTFTDEEKEGDAAKQRTRGMRGMKRLFKPAAISMLEGSNPTRAEKRRQLAKQLKKLRIYGKSFKGVIADVKEFNSGRKAKDRLTFKSVMKLSQKE